MYRMDKGAEENTASRAGIPGRQGSVLKRRKGVRLVGDGIHIAKGETALYALKQLILGTVERRIGSTGQGRYLPQAHLLCERL